VAASTPTAAKARVASASTGRKLEATPATAPVPAPKNSVVLRATAYTPTLVMMANSAATGAVALA
jgi:hypothetical protein